MSAAVEKILTGAELRSLSVRSDWRGAARLLVHVLLLAGSGWLVWRAGPWTLLPAMLLLGIVQAALFAPIHETMNMTAFLSRRANTVVGWLAACPSLLNWHFYMAFHLAHHRHTQDPERDPELLLPAPSTLDGYLWRVMALPYWRTRLTVLWDGIRGDLSAYPYIVPRAAPRIIRSLRGMALFVLACAALSMALVGWWAPLVFWIGPQLLGQPFLRLYLLTEHTLCTMDDNGLTNTRTTLTNGLMRLVMWNMPFHTEHHLYPSIPFHRLPEAHQAMRERLGVLQDGYARWHIGFVRSLRT
ncbi:fatty acid desaturase [uncultured Enterovirga sp.]|uniref:fatty acid desaturase n=1 Tax=uncultured Enterovirga sp. TaxID=2026352 RepID=UPI0035C9B49A